MPPWRAWATSANKIRVTSKRSESRQCPHSPSLRLCLRTVHMRRRGLSLLSRLAAWARGRRLRARLRLAERCRRWVGAVTSSPAVGHRVGAVIAGVTARSPWRNGGQRPFSTQADSDDARVSGLSLGRRFPVSGRVPCLRPRSVSPAAFPVSGRVPCLRPRSLSLRPGAAAVLASTSSTGPGRRPSDPPARLWPGARGTSSRADLRDPPVPLAVGVADSDRGTPVFRPRPAGPGTP